MYLCPFYLPIIEKIELLFIILKSNIMSSNEESGGRYISINAEDLKQALVNNDNQCKWVVIYLLLTLTLVVNPIITIFMVTSDHFEEQKRFMIAWSILSIVVFTVGAIVTVIRYMRKKRSDAKARNVNSIAV